MGLQVLADTVVADGEVYETIGEHIRRGAFPRANLPQAIRSGTWNYVVLHSDGTDVTVDTNIDVAFGNDSITVNERVLGVQVINVEGTGSVKCMVSHTQTNSIINVGSANNFDIVEMYLLVRG